MPIYQRAKEAGVFSSSDVALLGRVYDRLKTDRQSKERLEALASRIIANWLAGLRDEDELVTASKLSLGAEQSQVVGMKRAESELEEVERHVRPGQEYIARQRQKYPIQEQRLADQRGRRDADGSSRPPAQPASSI